VLACVGSLFVSAPALAAGRAGDVAATQAYLRASEVYERSASAELGADVAEVETRESEIAGACPSALTYAPRDSAFGEIGDEASTTLFDADVATMSVARLAFARTIDRLSWSDRRLTRLVRGLAAEEVAGVRLALPDVCADIEAWKASAYATLPQSSISFLARVAAIESGSYVGPAEESRETVIMRLLGRYESRGEKRVTKRAERHEQRTRRVLGTAVEAALARLATALGVSAL
jgi:hypothetical protein